MEGKLGLVGQQHFVLLTLFNPTRLPGLLSDESMLLLRPGDTVHRQIINDHSINVLLILILKLLKR